MFEENEFHQQRVVFVCLQTKRMYLFCKSISQSILHFLQLLTLFCSPKSWHTFTQRKLAVHYLINTQQKAETGRRLHWRRRHRKYALWCFCQLHVGILHKVFSFAFSIKCYDNRTASPMINWTWNWSEKNVPKNVLISVLMITNGWKERLLIFWSLTSLGTSCASIPGTLP